MVKRITALLLVLSLALALAGCSGGSQSPAAPGGGEDPAEAPASGDTGSSGESGERVDVIFKHVWTGTQGDWLVDQANEFNASQDTTTAAMEYIPFDDMNTQVAIDLASNSVAELYGINNPDFASCIEMGLLADITDLMNDWEDTPQFFERSIDSAMLNGRYYGIPSFDTNCLAMFYNKTVLEDAGVSVPTTWAELEAACEVVTDSTAGRYGLVISAIDAEDGTFQFIPWLGQAGGEVLQVDSDASVQALTYLRDMINNGYMSPEVLTFKQGDALNRWLSGQAVFMTNGSWNLNTVRVEYEDLDFEWSVAMLPAGPGGDEASVMGGKNIGCGATGHVEEAFAFLKHIGSKECMLEFATRFGGVPNRGDVAADPVWEEDYELNIFVKQMDTALPRGPHPKWPEISQYIRTAIGSGLSGAAEPEEALKVAQEGIDKLL